MYNNENKGHFPGPAIVAPFNPDDWIFWGPGQILGQGPLAAYLGSAGHVEPAIFRCPSDTTDGSGHYNPNYTYSYTVNWMICEPRTYPTAPYQYSGFDAYPAGDSRRNPNLVNTRIRDPFNVVLAIDESNVTIDDGCWAPQHYNGTAISRNLLSDRHDKQQDNASDPNGGRGNCVFCDGHAEFFERYNVIQKQSYDPRKLGDYSPNDPVIPP